MATGLSPSPIIEISIMYSTAAHSTKCLLAAVIVTMSVVPLRAAIVITEVDPAGSFAYGADWWEITNTGTTSVDITGWKMDDNSDSFTLAVPIRNITGLPAANIIAPGKSVVFFEGTSSGSTDATIAANFETAWFGANVPSGFLIGAYGGSGVGLSQTADAVNLFDSTGAPQASVSFNATSLGATLDNAAGLNNTTISQTSVAGTNGAFLSANGVETGSPGVIANSVPEPSALLASIGGLGMLAICRRRNA